MSQGKATLISVTVKSVALSIVEIRLAEGISQLVSGNRVFLKFHSNLKEALRIALKAFLRLR